MKIALFHRIVSSVLSFVILFSTMSFKVEKHYCGNTLVDVAIFTASEKCGMEMVEMSSNTSINKKSCCKDEVDVIAGQDDLTLKSFDDLHKIQKSVLIAYAYSYVNLYESLPKQIIPHRDYSPPTLIKDIHILDETFLI